jgi:hypothetical protein
MIRLIVCLSETKCETCAHARFVDVIVEVDFQLVLQSVLPRVVDQRLDCGPRSSGVAAWISLGTCRHDKCNDDAVSALES